MVKKQYIIPIFVPHLGCPNECTFCNQKKISGQLKNVTEKDVRDTIEYYLENFKDKDVYKEVAFFGGSFTAIAFASKNVGVKDYKTVLQEKLQENGEVSIKYEIIKEEGPDHNKLFTAQVECDGEKLAVGSGKSKKSAEMEAAKKALDKIYKE